MIDFLFVSAMRFIYGTCLISQMVKNLPAVQETWVQSLGWKDPLEKGMATQYSILVQWIPWTEGAWWAATVIFIYVIILS